MKTSVISPEFRERYLPDPSSSDVLEARAIVFDGPEDYHHRIDDSELAIDGDSLLVMRGAGPIRLRCHLPARRSAVRVTIDPQGVGRGGLALLRTGDRVRIDLVAGTADALVAEAEWARRRRERESAGGYPVSASPAPWQEIQRSMVGQLGEGMVLEPAVAYRRVLRSSPVPRDNH